MRFRTTAGTLLASMLWTLPGIVALPTTALAQGAPQTALVASVAGTTLTLAIGSEDGAKIGQTYRLSHDNLSAKIRITATTDSQSIATIISADAGFVAVVGDSAISLDELVAAPNPPATLPNAPTQPVGNGAPNAGAPVLVTGVNGNVATLSIGAVDGAVLGAVYALPLTGNVQARLQISEVRPSDSSATIQIVQEGFTPTVGDATRFIGVEAIPVPTVPTVTPTVPTTPTLPLVPSGQLPGATNPTSPVASTGTQVSPAPIAALSGSTATITQIEGQGVVISAGTAQGAKPALNLPILRGGEVIGLLRLQVVSANSSTGIVLWRDETLSPVSPGDAVGILGAPPSVGIPAVGEVITGKPLTTAIAFETGASNLGVPKANAAYELLAALASGNLIQSQPPSVFQDDGARRHNSQEDIVFSRAQIAEFIREAISRYDDTPSSRSRAALAILTKEFRPDLLKIGETAATLSPFSEKGVAVGVSSYTRFTLAKGDTSTTNRDPFAESYGARRSKSGFDSRTNIFAQLAPRLSFYSSFDYGKDIRNGNSNVFDFAPGNLNKSSEVSNLQVRKAYVSYDASSMLRGLTIDVGRKEFWWGPGHFGTSVLGDSPGGLNSISTNFERGSYRLQGVFSPLGRGPAGGARSLYGQNLSVKIGESARIGATTMILSPKDSFDPKLFFGAFTPISLYILDRQGNLEDNTNAIVGAYAEAGIAKGARVYGEITLDDLSLNSKNRIENRNGSVVGAELFNPKNPAKAGFSMEYARFNNLTYLAFLGSVRDMDYYYQYRDSPLGYPISPVGPNSLFGGSESLRFEGRYMPTKRLRLTAGAEFSDINAEDQGPAPLGGLGFTRQQVYRFAATYDLSRSFSVTARAQRIDTDQPNFVKGEPSAADRFFSLEIGRSF